MTEGHAQELKTQALALQVGKRLRIMLSDNNAGIDDALLGGVVAAKFDGYNLVDQWTSYGWNVFTLDDGNDYAQIVSALKTMEDWDPSDRRPMIVIGKTTKGYWPRAVDGKIPRPRRSDRELPEPSLRHEDEFGLFRRAGQDVRGALRRGVRGHPQGRGDRSARAADPVQNQYRRRDVGARPQRPGRLAGGPAGCASATQCKDDYAAALRRKDDPFLDDRLRVANLPVEPQKVTATNRLSGAKKQVGDHAVPQARRNRPARAAAISEIIKWMNYVTDNRFFTLAADLSESINVEHGSLWGHYDPETNPLGTRIKAAIQEAGNVSTAIGLVSQSASVDPEKFSGVWALSGTYGAFTPLMYTPARVWSQQNQDSKFRMGVLHILAGHSGPETAADGRTHFGIFAHAGVEAVSARPDHSPEFLGLQRRRAGLFRRRGNRRARSQGRHHQHRSGAARFSGRRSQPSSPTPISRPPRRAST